MGKVTILEETTKDPITKMGRSCGLCWGSKTSDPTLNYKRGKKVMLSGHGRVEEFAHVEMVLEGYSARVIREWYTHIVGASRLQASTRYIDYTKNGGFKYVTPPSIARCPQALEKYQNLMKEINDTCKELEDVWGIPREDSAMLLPLGMKTIIVDIRNFRSLVEMSHQRMCSRAYWEYRRLFNDICNALSEYSPEWKEIVDLMFHPKCEVLGYCPEEKSCGRMPKKEK